MFRLSKLPARLLVAVMLASAVLLAGCHRTDTRQQEIHDAQLQKQFDMTVQSYKSGQFMLGGAVLSSTDLYGHLAYLKDQGKLPKTVLLLPSDDSKIRKEHLQYMARLALDFGFVVYYEHKGQLVQIDAVDTKPRELQDYRPTSRPSGDEGAPQGGGHPGSGMPGGG